jgi:hypothetical protein
MQATDHNPQLTRLLQIMTAIEAVVLIVSFIGLFFLYDIAKPYWPWDITPFNARFISAIYAASLVVVVLLALHNRWSPARNTLPMIGIFTAIVLGITLLYWSQFNASRLSTWIWLLIYAVLPLNAAYHLWKYRRLPPADVTRFPAWVSPLLIAQAVILAVYSLAMFVAPAASTSFWPWAVDAFHARVYAPIFLAAAFGSLLASRAASREELMGLGAGQAVFGAVVILGTFYVDSIVHRINWSLPTTWLFIAIFGLALLIGLAYVIAARQSPSAVPAPARS